MDLFGDLLRVTGVTGSIGTRIEASGDWGLRLQRFPGAALHAVTDGSAWLSTSTNPAQRLDAGDIVLLPPGTVHALTSAPRGGAGPCDRAEAARAREEGDVVRLGCGPVTARIVTVHYLQHRGARTSLLDGLPDILRIEPGAGERRLQDTVRLIAHELAEPGMATSVVLDRIVDVLLVQTLRAWASRRDATQPGWLAGFHDPVVRAALTLVHEQPERAWTTESLANRLNVSRATLARRFAASMETTPAAYLLGWRMDLAAARLRDTDDPLPLIARSVGYSSVYAFSRAFSRNHGDAPGQYRGRHRVSQAHSPVPLAGTGTPARHGAA